MKRTTQIPEKTNGEVAKSVNLADYSKEQLMVYSSEIMNRAALSARLGQQYDGDRDIYEALGYPLNITYDDYYARYSRQDIAKAIINKPVQYTWKGPLRLTETGTSKESELEVAWRKLERALKIKSKFVRLDKLSSIKDYGVLLLGFNDVKKQEDWIKPVGGKNLELMYVKPLGQNHAKISTYVNRTSNPRYGMVEFYDVEFTNPGGETTTVFKAHYSRVLHVTSELLESEVEGIPVLMSVWNRLMDLEKLVGGSAEMFWRGARPGFQGVVNDDYQMTPAVEAALQDQLDEYEHNLRRVLVNEGVELKGLAPQVADPKEHVDIQVQMISSITGIPKRILTGTERGELASGQDITSWYSTVQSRREEHAEQNIVRPFVDKMIELKILPEPSTEDYQIQWKDLYSDSDMAMAEVGRVRATALREYVQNPLAATVLPPEAFMKWFLGLDPDQVQEIQEMTKDMMNDESMQIIRDSITSTGTGDIESMKESVNKKDE